MRTEQRGGGASGQEFLIDRNVRIPTDDPDVTLSAVVYRPAGSDPVPALVSVYP